MGNLRDEMAATEFKEQLRCLRGIHAKERHQREESKMILRTPHVSDRYTMIAVLHQEISEQQEATESQYKTPQSSLRTHHQDYKESEGFDKK